MLRSLAAATSFVALYSVLGCAGDETPSATTSSGSATGGGLGGAGGAGSSEGGSGGSAAMADGGSGGVAGSDGGTGGGGGFPGNYDCSAPVGQPPALKLALVGAFQAPLLVKSAPGDPRLYVVEQAGRILILDGDAPLSPPFLDISTLVKAGGEEGLLGLAFHPDYSTNGRFFVHYSAATTGAAVIEEYLRSPDPDVAVPVATATTLTEPQAGDSHNGGSIEFGPDGMLYIALGDGGDPLASPDPNSRLGKVLRIDVTTTPYSIPAGNMPGGKPEVWDMGLRNPYRISFDPCGGDLYIGDVGAVDVEEINVEPAGKGNANYGWNVMEGSDCYAGSTCDKTGLVAPTVEYGHSDGCAVIGGYVHRSAAIPGLRGMYFYGDHCSRHVWSFSWSNGQPVGHTSWSPNLMPPGDAIRSFGQDDVGNVYMLAGNFVYRIDAE